MSDRLDIICLHALDKVFPNPNSEMKPAAEGSALLNEVYSYQVAYSGDRLLHRVQVAVHSVLAPYIRLYSVGLVPSEYPIQPDHDDDILSAEPGLYPDPLLPIDPIEGVIAVPGQWRSIWITVDPAGQAAAGRYPIELVFTSEAGERLAGQTFNLELINAKLPEQELIYTNWFHSDCLSTHYGTEVFSEEHWEIIGRFVETAARGGMNMILTPVFTPPLDTEVGKERPTVQLVDVVKEDGQYRFGFSRLNRWIELCQSKGIRYFEISHLFTQWGAKHAPKIVATENGKPGRIFGWETDAFGAEYRAFLSAFLPELVAYLREKGLEDKVYFHVSDEPSLNHMEAYRQASEMLGQHVEGFPVIDALSDYDFYKYGLVKRPIPASNHIDAFLEGGGRDLWTYYCVSQYKKVANRFIAMPSYRNRILGYQLYKYNISGFLHWGYNFWYSGLSRKSLNPFQSTDSNRWFPSGDGFVVYPGEQGEPIESLRLRVFHDTLQDLRALRLLEKRIGRAEVLALIEEGLNAPLTFDEYPRNAEWIRQTRQRVNAKIAETAK
ncbi:DUF4091 domain-containing protein [Paenibacillus arenilitoris]|uniref:DUF4091 domain-containing protein n=1 Tax=Paenibacillus arenilitoris TaxID=2772299 RepID=A0A927CJN6_9BACL|nr:DUF4091 domain-containing protein [Paenibacillus arenilitoris]MBD2869309.1 DUF4091 domain-containing protein [Paenibacillus arenilitoris]